MGVPNIKEDICDLCGDHYTSFMEWYGLPFKKMDRSTTTLCIYCLSALQPIMLPLDGDDSVSITGTHAGDIYSLSEMIEDGFSKKKATISIKAVGKAIGLPTKVIIERLAG